MRAGGGLHQRSPAWAGGPSIPPTRGLPIVPGTVIQLVVERIPDGRKPPRDLWLWQRRAGTGACGPDVAGLPRRFDQEHFHRFAKVHLGSRACPSPVGGGDRPLGESGHAAYGQLRLASPLVERPPPPLATQVQPGVTPSPYRVRLGFRDSAPDSTRPPTRRKNSRPGPGRPRGSKKPAKKPNAHRITKQTASNRRRRVTRNLKSQAWPRHLGGRSWPACQVSSRMRRVVEAGFGEAVVGVAYLVGHGLGDRETLFWVDLDALGVAYEHVDGSVDVVDHPDVVV